jgi:hypothetical protein
MQTRDGFHRSFLISPKKGPHNLIGDYHCATHQNGGTRKNPARIVSAINSTGVDD